MHSTARRRPYLPPAKANWLVGPDPTPASDAPAELSGRAAGLALLLLLTIAFGILFGIIGTLLWQGQKSHPLSLPDSPPAASAPAYEAFEL